MKYTTEMGIEVDVRSIPIKLIEKIAAGHPDPDPPTYSVETLGGATETHVLTEQSADTPEEKARLADWRMKKAQVERARNNAVLHVFISRGIHVELPDDIGWAVEQIALGISVPTAEPARRLHYIETEVMGGLADYNNVSRMIMEMSGVSEAAIAQASAIFPGNVVRDPA